MCGPEPTPVLFSLTMDAGAVSVVEVKGSALIDAIIPAPGEPAGCKWGRIVGGDFGPFSSVGQTPVAFTIRVGRDGATPGPDATARDSDGMVGTQEVPWSTLSANQYMRRLNIPFSRRSVIRLSTGTVDAGNFTGQIPFTLFVIPLPQPEEGC